MRLTDHQFYAVGGFQTKSILLFTVNQKKNLDQITFEQKLSDMAQWEGTAAVADGELSQFQARGRDARYSEEVNFDFITLRALSSWLVGLQFKNKL